MVTGHLIAAGWELGGSTGLERLEDSEPKGSCTRGGKAWH